MNLNKLTILTDITENDHQWDNTFVEQLTASLQSGYNTAVYWNERENAEINYVFESGDAKLLATLAVFAHTKGWTHQLQAIDKITTA